MNNATVLDVNMDKFSGSRDGYSYQYVSTVDSRHAVYRITNPNGVSRLVECNADGVTELAISPRAFWEKYVGV